MCSPDCVRAESIAARAEPSAVPRRVSSSSHTADARRQAGPRPSCDASLPMVCSHSPQPPGRSVDGVTFGANPVLSTLPADPVLGMLPAGELCAAEPKPLDGSAQLEPSVDCGADQRC
eukprot:4611166-Prymnesium_polylepis.1